MDRSIDRSIQSDGYYCYCSVSYVVGSDMYYRRSIELVYLEKSRREKERSLVFLR